MLDEPKNYKLEMYNIIQSFLKADERAGRKKYISKPKIEKWDKTKRSMLYLQIMKLLPPREDSVPDKWEELEKAEDLQTNIQKELIPDDNIEDQNIHIKPNTVLQSASIIPNLSGGNNNIKNILVGGNYNLTYINNKILLLNKVIKYKLKHIYKMFNLIKEDGLEELIKTINECNDNNILNLYLIHIKELDKLIRKYHKFQNIKKLIESKNSHLIDKLIELDKAIQYIINQFYSTQFLEHFLE
jgi:hypothetical protein